ncbi:MAG: ImmA/IrrE family metallo-endopeptidase [Panacagrimonas sp.]
MFLLLRKTRIDGQAIAYGQSLAGHVRVAVGRTWKTANGAKRRDYAIRVNAAHDPNVQFATLAHELVHLYLGHLGRDDRLDIKSRRGLGHTVEELEAETVAYLVCERQGVRNESESYLATFIRDVDAVGSASV